MLLSNVSFGLSLFSPPWNRVQKIVGEALLNYPISHGASLILIKDRREKSDQIAVIQNDSAREDTMREVMTKSMARNIFYGGSLFFLVIFLLLTYQSRRYIETTSTNAETLTASVVAGKRVWERKACINCHTILGEGAYFAPELGNVMKRWGVDDDPQDAFETLQGWMESQPSGIEGRRQMPQFNLTDEEIRNLSDFLLWTGTIDTQGWPPTDAG